MNAFKTTTTVAALAAVFALSACDRNADERTAGERLDGAVASAERRADEARSDIKRESAEARNDINTAANQAGDKMKDASITTKVNAELARDNDLSALKIDVDTSDGRVVLRGAAPTAEARDRATIIAQRVEGVLSVDNQLTVGQRG
ncbi:BON domain-containing protein [Rhizobacter sp. J219]|uniref:BON domain-containing protein n=1 Tax=Rhizobacter sp. J219 TaxID=2898430 RepID=UPI0021508699|nr:BON domain-containing protein [Rhizobacter sp. J219]MCR5886051.1 BON domain-containing protein [Rhizobacter sp. J219]